MKKRVSILLAALILTSLCSCGNSNSTSMKSPYEHGLEVIAILDEMVNSEMYLSLMRSSSDIQEVADQIKQGDYTEPDSVYRISALDTYLTDMFAMMGDTELLEGMSDTLKERLEKNALTSVGSFINAQTGVSAIAASSLYTASRIFVSDEVSEDMLYLYTYESGYPILIAFTTGEDSACVAAGNFILNKDYDADTAQQLKDLLTETGMFGSCEVEEVPKK